MLEKKGQKTENKTYLFQEVLMPVTRSSLRDDVLS